MFTRIGAAALKADLTNTIELCKRVGNPQDKFKSIHIAGTNGKGSTSHMLAAILQTAGYKTALYTSPHLKDFRERIRINGKMISENLVVNFVNSQRASIEEIDPSFFEVTVAMAFQHFTRQEVDIAVIEVGLGGRLDSTNIIKPLVSVITNIGFDHVNILGDTLPKIASEKAGIIKFGVPVVVGERHPETVETFIKKSIETQSELIFACDDWLIRKSGNQESKEHLQVHVQKTGTSYSDGDSIDLALDLTGSYQLKNLATVLSAVSELRKAGFSISADHVKSGLKQVRALTGLQGRWQVLATSPLVISDTGHNEDGIREVLKNIADQQYKTLRMVIGMVKDKDVSHILKMLPKNAVYYFCSPDIPRAKPAAELRDEGGAFGLTGDSYDSVSLALTNAKSDASADDLIFVGGSTFVVGEII